MRPDTTTGLDALWYHIMGYLAELPMGERQAARRILVNRLRHSELGSHPEWAGNVHQGCSTNRAAHQGGPMCVCGRSRRAHDIDGQRNDCDGYVEAK